MSTPKTAPNSRTLLLEALYSALLSADSTAKQTLLAALHKRATDAPKSALFSRNEVLGVIDLACTNNGKCSVAPRSFAAAPVQQYQGTLPPVIKWHALQQTALKALCAVLGAVVLVLIGAHLR